jgi:hypothetical protein
MTIGSIASIASIGGSSSGLERGREPSIRAEHAAINAMSNNGGDR